MKRYMLFGGDDFYPRGGMADCMGSFESSQMAYVEAIRLSPNWFHVVDSRSGEVVMSSWDYQQWHGDAVYSHEQPKTKESLNAYLRENGYVED